MGHLVLFNYSIIYNSRNQPHPGTSVEINSRLQTAELSGRERQIYNATPGKADYNKLQKRIIIRILKLSMYYLLEGSNAETSIQR